MKNLIIEKIKEIEDKSNVKVLFAVESGSRAWGYSSNNSDYDVRFIYCPPPEWYLSIDPQGVGGKRDVIELSIDELLDINGWEITKALRLFRKSNPTLFEWMRSEIVYYQNSTFLKRLNLLESKVFNSKVCLHHYFNVAKTNYQKCSQKNKLYFYVLRSLFVCKWIMQNHSFPPIDFQQLLHSLDIQGELKEEIEILFEHKKRSKLEGFEGKLLATNGFIETELIRLQDYISSLTAIKNVDTTEQLDNLFRETLRAVW
ncbi:DNA polymerase beta superfamily protein [Lysinibacillus endophyticus]|uniref:nucleotidyltransferase domain-containing protein n=1 Tax=Ureibacillus endophyticus TaxID=1978490 RepID=UPI00209E9A6A|nr:nucleotidyltransferase domain-containing protein [Lysinibacillus endophyticus]MCP1146550.1 nucleotidyltransferase domain-containing protein [Lysinibacillus endophyticus]